MLWTICLILGIIIAAGAAFYAAYIARNKRSRIRGLRPIHVLIGGCFLAAVMLQIPVLRYEAEQAGGDDEFSHLIRALPVRPSMQIFSSSSKWTWRRYSVSKAAGMASRRAASKHSPSRA